VATELRQAGERFCMAVEADDRLALLSLVDLIRAYADAGIFLSRATRRYLRQAHTHLPFGNTKLYEAVRDGKVKLPWIKGIRVSLREEGKDL